MSDQFSWWLTLLGLIPFLFGIGLFFVYLQSRKWKSDVVEGLAALRIELRNSQNIIRNSKQVVQAFSIEDPEPFGELVGQIIQGISSCETALAQHYQRYGVLHARANDLARQAGFDRLRNLLAWYPLDQAIQSLHADLVSGEDAVRAIAEPVDRLSRLGWEMASHSREILRAAQNASEMFRELSQEALIEDAEFETAWQESHEWEQTLLNQVPVVFYQDDEQTVLNRTDKDMTAHVYRVIKAAGPAVQALSEKAQRWQGDYAKLARLTQSVHLDYKQTAQSYSRLENSSVLPIDWEKTRAVMIRIDEQLGEVGAVIQKRSLEKLTADLNHLESLQARVTDIGKHVNWIGELQNKFVSKVDVITRQRKRNWLPAAILLAEQAAQYDPENFLGETIAHNLQNELQQLAGQLSKILAVDMNQKIRESALPGWVQNAERAVILQENLRSQSEMLRTQFVEMQSIEQAHRDQLLRGRALLGQTAALIGSNAFLKREVRNEPEELSTQIEGLIAELDQRARGTIATKVKKITSARKRLEQTFARWIDILEKEFTQRNLDLENKTDILASKLKLDEPVLSEAVRFLRQRDVELTEQEGRSGSDIWIAQVERLKELNQAYQYCLIYLQRLEEFAGTVLEMYQKTEKHRQAAVDSLEKAKQVAPETLKWPPCTQHLLNEGTQLQTLEQRWVSLLQEPLKAIQMVGKLSELSERYQILEVQLNQLVDTALQEQKRVLEYEKRLDDSIKMWQRQVAQNSKNRTVQIGVEDLLDEIHREHEALKQRYERGVIRYPQALQGMRQICRRIDEASVPLNEQQAIDINGTIQRRL